MKVPYGIKQPATLCILRSERGLLLLKRKKPPYVGMFVPIGGKIDPHESAHDAAIRETYEEAGLTLKVMQLAGILTETSPAKYNWVNYVYTAQVPAFDPPPCDEGELRWLPDADLDTIPTPQTDHYIYDYVRRGVFFALDAHFDADVNLLSLRDEISGVVL